MLPSVHDIARRAYAKWVRHGRRAGTQVQDWLQAEAELRQVATLGQQLAERSLPESAQFLRSILDNSTAVVYVKDTAGRYLFVNHRYEVLFHIKLDAVLGKTDHDLFPKERADAFRRNDVRVLAAETPLEFEEEVPQEDGLHTYLSLKFPICGSTDVPYAVCGFSTDVTERKRAEKALLAREQELAIARRIQQGLFPATMPAAPGFQVWGACRPAQETGGDYLDFLPLRDGSLGIAVGDASGHGIGAALLMAETRAYLRARAETDTDVSTILTLVNRHLAEDVCDEHFVTLLLARLDPATGALSQANAGHWPGYHLDGDGRLKRELRSTGLPLGLDAARGVPGEPAGVLEPGDLLVLLTDGVVEASARRGPLFGARRALDVVRAHRHDAPREIVAALFEQVQAFAGGRQDDDMTAIVVRAEGSRAARG